MMNKSLVLKYIEDNKVLELIEKLSLRPIEHYNSKEYRRLIEILVVLLNHVEFNYYHTVQQYLFTTIFKVKNDAFLDKKSIDEFIQLIKSCSDPNYKNIAGFIQRFIINILDNVDDLNNLSTSDYLKMSLLNLNIEFLKENIRNQASYEDVSDILYACVKSMEVGRRVILSRNAIEIFKVYVERNPLKYLMHFIRPYYSLGPTKERAEYYLHVGEPFNHQIFGNDFENFLLDLEKNNELVSDIIDFNNKMNANPKNRDKVVLLFSNQNKESLNLENHLRLRSPDHIYVRPECKPPDYL